MYSITFIRLPLLPPPKIPLVDDDNPAKLCFASLKSPKSCASPNVDMFMYSITFIRLLLLPPPKIPRTGGGGGIVYTNCRTSLTLKKTDLLITTHHVN